MAMNDEGRQTDTDVTQWTSAIKKHPSYLLSIETRLVDTRTHRMSGIIVAKSINKHLCIVNKYRDIRISGKNKKTQ